MRAGFIGLGRMGRPMAINMRRKGFALTVHDISAEAIAALEAEGARRGNGVAGVAAASVVVAGLGYALVYRPHRATEQTRAQISVDGPKIVADMLSYTVKAVDDDFAAAQRLVTDGYRPELIKQQESVRKLGLVDNEFWSSNNAVLSASENRATMLLLLQGQRGVAPKQRFVTASVRASFEKSGDQWLVSDLTVLSPPKPSGPTPPAPAATKPPAPAAPKGPGR